MKRLALICVVALGLGGITLVARMSATSPIADAAMRGDAAAVRTLHRAGRRRQRARRATA